MSVDTSDNNIMKRPPRDPKSSIMDKKMFSNILFISIAITIATLILFNFGLAENIKKAQTIAFTTLVAMELVRVQTVRAKYGVKFFSNKYIVGAVALSLFLQMAIIYSPLNTFFNTVPLGLKDLFWIFGAAFAVYLISVIVRFIKKFLENKKIGFLQKA